MWTPLKIQLLRSYFNISRVDLARYLDVSTDYIRRVEGYRATVRDSLIPKLEELSQYTPWCGRDLKIYRLKTGISRQDLAQQLNISTGKLVSWETNKIRIPIQIQIKLNSLSIPDNIDWSKAPWSGAGLKSILKKMKWFPSRLARELNLDISTVSLWINDKSIPINKEAVFEILIKELGDKEWIVNQMLTSKRVKKSIVVWNPSSDVYIHRSILGKNRNLIPKK